MTHSYGDSCVHDYESEEDIMNQELPKVDSGGKQKGLVANIIVITYKLDMIDYFYCVLEDY